MSMMRLPPTLHAALALLARSSVLARLLRNELRTLILSAQFMTRIPIPVGNAYSPERLGAAVRYYPLIGVLIGVLCASTYWGAQYVFPPVVAVILSFGMGLLLTGALHEDGLADTVDGVGGGHDRGRALEIMKDSRVGVYGVLALIVVVGLKIMALALMPPMLAAIALVAAHGLSRLSCVIAIVTSRYVREQGTGSFTLDGPGAGGLAIAVSTGALLLVGLGYLVTPSAAGWAFLGIMVGHAAMRWFYEHKLGGYTGDTLGAIQQVSEVGFYLALLGWL